MNCCDILCLQEHWLLNYEKNVLTSIFPDHNFVIKCTDDNNPDLPMYRRRGKAGTAVIWKKHLDHLIEPLPDGSDRVQAISVALTVPPLLLINTYMPTMGSKDPEYAETLDEVNELIIKFWHMDLLWTGDINADIQRTKPYPNDKQLQSFLLEHSLTVSEMQAQICTYHHFNGTSSSRIDMFIEKCGKQKIRKVLNETRHVLNTSAHDPITAVLDPPEIYCSPSDQSKNQMAAPQRIKWSTVDYQRYDTLTESRLKILENSLDGTPIDVIAAQLNDILVRSAAEACPARKPLARRKPRKRPWNPQLKPLVQHAKSLYYKTKNSKNPGDILALKAAKKSLRKAQRQAAAKVRRETKNSIITAAKSKDKGMFYKLIRKQRQTGLNAGAIDFRNFEKGNQQDSWASYFQHLATPAGNDTFSKEYEDHLQIMYSLRKMKMDDRMVVTPVTRSEVSQYIAKMKSGKAPDVYGVSAEHLKLASCKIVDILCHICNVSISTGKLPSTFKLGVLSPVLKKNKSHKEPNNYRRITVTSIVGRILEQHMMTATSKHLDNWQSHLQFGFTTECSPMYAALALTEVMGEAKDSGSQLFITFMDASKAFDIVNHQSMLNALYEQNVIGNLWNLYNSMYTDIQSVVKWEGVLSERFSETQGIRQGGISSPSLYKANRNKGLIQLNKNPTMYIGSLNVGAIMVADDLALTANTPHQMQTALLIAQEDAAREQYIYNTQKTKTVTINATDEHTFILNDKPIGSSNSEKHLGILRNSKNSNSETIDCRIRDARRTAYSLLGAGLCGLNGSGPEIGMTLYSTYVLPVLMYGLETLVLQSKDLDKLETYHRRNLRHLLHLPPSTSSAVVYLLSGCAPIEAHIHIRILVLFGNIVQGADKNSPSNFIYELIRRQVAVKDSSTSSWAPLVRRLLFQYDLPTAYDIFDCPPKIGSWKKRVRTAVYDVWTARLKEESQDMSSLKFVNMEHLYIGKMHKSLLNAMDTHSVHKITVATKLLVRRYPLSSNQTAGKRKTDLCQLCKTGEEDELHFILHCPKLLHARLPKLMKILEYIKLHGLSIDPDKLVTYVLDPVGSQLPKDLIDLSRDMLYALHINRVNLLTLESGSPAEAVITD
jgi:hypothetical protein